MNRAPVKPGTVIGVKYRLERMLGQGGMGSVFAAENLITGKRVAIKCMNPDIAATAEAATRFLREAKASARIRHPNVVDVYDVLSVDDTIFLIMELLEGEPLSDFLARDAMPVPQLMKLLLDAMRGVVAAHREGVIHRDVKPENIFLAREGDDARIVPKVLDFGISKIQGTQEIALTAPGSALGTVLYMATEQLTGAADVDARADVYAFGVILYQAMTGRFPFLAESFSALVLRIMTEQAVPVRQLRPDLPPKIAQLTEWAMAKQRNDRLPSLEVFIAELEPFANEAKYGHLLTRTTSRISLRPPSHEALPVEAPVPAVTVLPTTREWVPETPTAGNHTPFVANDATLRVPQQPKSRAASLAAAVFAALALAGVAFWQWQREQAAELPIVVPQPVVSAPAEPAPVPQPETKAIEPGRAEPVQPASPPQRPTTPAFATQPRVRNSGNVGQSVRPVSAAPAAIPPVPSAAPEQNSRPTAQPTAAKKPSCNPNFYFDAQGEKHFKPECF